MKNKFIGKWKCNDNTIEINSKNKTFTCTLERNNIGILFKDSLLVSEFDHDVKAGGIGVYSPIGDGTSNFALWSSTRIHGLLGSGITLKCDNSEGFVGEYLVRYFVTTHEVNSLTVKIELSENKQIYKLLWYQNDQKILHGIGLLIDDSLAFSWGSVDCEFDFDVFKFSNDDCNVLEMQHVKWSDPKIYSSNFIGTI